MAIVKVLGTENVFYDNTFYDTKYEGLFNLYKDGFSSLWCLSLEELKDFAEKIGDPVLKVRWRAKINIDEDSIWYGGPPHWSPQEVTEEMDSYAEVDDYEVVGKTTVVGVIGTKPDPQVIKELEDKMFQLEQQMKARSQLLRENNKLAASLLKPGANMTLIKYQPYEREYGDEVEMIVQIGEYKIRITVAGEDMFSNSLI